MNITDALQIVEEHSAGATENLLRETRYYILRLEDLLEIGAQAALSIKDPSQPTPTAEELDRLLKNYELLTK